MKITLPTGERVPSPRAESDVAAAGDGRTPMLNAGFAQPWVRPITRPEELEAVKRAAAADGHSVIGATHLIERHGVVIGYGSIGGAMLVNVWVQTGGVKPRESLMLLNMAENLAALRAGVASQGAQIICVPCSTESPFRPLMVKLGYGYAGESGSFLKRLR